MKCSNQVKRSIFVFVPYKFFLHFVVSGSRWILNYKLNELFLSFLKSKKIDFFTFLDSDKLWYKFVNKWRQFLYLKKSWKWILIFQLKRRNFNKKNKYIKDHLKFNIPLKLINLFIMNVFVINEPYIGLRWQLISNEKIENEDWYFD